MAASKNPGNLNKAQRSAVSHGEGPLLILAGGGTGKTRVIAHRIASLVDRGMKPDRILAVTFTNKAADEMRSRVRTLVSPKAAAAMTVSTFHALCLRILRSEHRAADLPPFFGVCDAGDQATMARRILREIQGQSAVRIQPGALLSRISRWKEEGTDPAAAAAGAETDADRIAARAYPRYEEALRRQGLLDFDDLLVRTLRLLKTHEEVRLRQAGRFDHVLVDEFQDTNGTQFEILVSLASAHRNVCVVGDDDQSIYAWRGARVENILTFDRRFKGTKVVRLEENYRSAPPILEAANRLIKKNRRRRAKRLIATLTGGSPVRFRAFEDEETEAEWIASGIAARIRAGNRPSEHAVLYRTNQQSRPFETAFREQRIPHVVVGGMSYFDRKEVRDLVAYLRVLRNPRDDASLLRILNVPSRGIGGASADRIVREASHEGAPVESVLSRASAIPGLSAAARVGVSALLSALGEMRETVRTKPLPEAVRALVERVRYQDEVESAAADPEDRLVRTNAVSDLARSAEQYARRAGANATLTGFLDDVALIGDDRSDKEKQLENEAAVLITLHSAKGLEFPCVFLVGLEEGLLPHERSVSQGGDGLSEERRLCYVGVTRAMRELVLTAAASHVLRGVPCPAAPSRFLEEMGFDVGVWPGEPSTPARIPPAPASPREGRGRAARQG